VTKIAPRPSGRLVRRNIDGTAYAQCMPEPTGAELDEIRKGRDELRAKYLTDKAGRSPSTARGIHHAAFVCRDVEETIRFYQEFLGFPLVELVENRDYAGSSHFFFDLGNSNLLGFFDFPGHDHEPYKETIGALQHLAISVTSDQFERAKAKLDDAGIDYLGPDRGADDSVYFRDPNGMGIELYREQLGRFEGSELL
jgi:glyoxylase I family protein